MTRFLGRVARPAALLGLAATLALAGCSRKDEASLSGRVVYGGGKPVTGYDLVIEPADKAAPYPFPLNDQGAFTSSAKISGTMKAYLRPMPQANGYQNPKGGPVERPKVVRPTPPPTDPRIQKYLNKQTSDWSWDIRAAGSNDRTFEVK